MRAIAALALGCLSCARTAPRDAGEIVFKHQPLWGDPAPFHALLDRFRRENPDLRVRDETMPNASDMAREMFLTALEGGGAEFDLFAIDVVWAPEFARAGWLADLSEEFPGARLREEYLPGAVE